MSGQVTSVMIVGVGGQGSLLASKLLGQLLMDAGLDVKVSEVHGMAQRGGSVVTYVKYGQQVASPVIEKGEADYLVAFEECEAARWLPYLKKGGAMIASTQHIAPMPVITGAAQYPADIAGQIRALGVDLLEVDALALAQEAGSPRAVNVVLMGVLSTCMEFSPEQWDRAIVQSVRPAFVDMNKKALALGAQAARAGKE